MEVPMRLVRSFVRRLVYAAISVATWLVLAYIFQGAITGETIVTALLGTGFFLAMDAVFDRNRGSAPTRRYGPRIDDRNE
jgi:hypothetical protein